MQVWCCWQVPLCDPHLSALEVRFHDEALYKCMFTFTFVSSWFAKKVINIHKTPVWVGLSLRTVCSDGIAVCTVLNRLMVNRLTLVNSVVVLKESPCPPGSSKFNLQVVVLGPQSP